MKEIRLLRMKRKLLKKVNKKNKDKQCIKMNKIRRKLLLQHIIDVKRWAEKEKIKKIADQIKWKGEFNPMAYWDFKKSMNKKSRIKGKSINDKNGNRIDDPERIKEVYKTHYKELLEVAEPRDEKEKEVEMVVDKGIKKMKEVAQKLNIQEITMEEYQNMKKSLKVRKAGDDQHWKYEFVINAGEDLEKSILRMMNEMVRNKMVPREWKSMEILPIDKGTGWLQMEEKRGLFMTNIISKCMEKILFKRRDEAYNKSISKFQCGGVTNRGTQDNLFIVNHTINEYKKKNENLYILYADIKKCFDNLWLKDCILEIMRCGIPIEEAAYIYEMNKDVKAVIKTPVGKTEEIKFEELVRQGTVGGTKLCGSSTDRLNKMGVSKESEDGIEYPIFVDDMKGMGDGEKIKDMVNKMRILTTTKKYEFNMKKGKTEWMSMNFNKKETIKELELEIGEKKIGRTYEYKYLGDVYNEKGGNESKIIGKETKLEGMINDVKTNSSKWILGKSSTQIRLMLIDTIITPTILTNTETWHDINQKEEKLITSIHHKILTRCLELPISTPYYGIISETNMMPYVDRIWKRKYMFYHRLINSKDRKAKDILDIQREANNNWYQELQEHGNENDIRIDELYVQNTSYETYKRHVKKQIKSTVMKRIAKKRETMKKLRYTNNEDAEEPYLKRSDVEETKWIMKLRLNMINTKENFKTNKEDTKCRICGKEDETTDHIIECFGGLKFVEKNMNEEEWLRAIVPTLKRFENFYNS